MAPLAATVAGTVAVGVGLTLAKAERKRRAARARLPPHERHFGLLSDESAADGLKRIALGQLDLAIELLRDESQAPSSVPPEKAVHETRKALKRLRSLMRLLEGEIGSKRAARERAVLRDAAARLAGARDAEVMVSTLDALVRSQPRKLGRRRGVVQLREHLRHERRSEATLALGDASATRAQVADELCALRKRVAKWKLSSRPVGKLVRPGLQHIYRSGRSGRGRAAHRKPGSRAMHKWRKHVKDLRYALEVLDVQDPPHKATATGSGKRARKRVAKLARRADELGEVLGQEHDLMLLGEKVRAHKPLKRHKRRTRKLLLRAISRRRARLRKRALRDGKRLYERKPRRFVRRIIRA